MNGFKNIRNKRFWQAFVLLAVDLIFFTRTDASKVAPIVLIAGFLLLVVTCYIGIYGLLSFARLYGIPFHHKKRLAMFLSGVVGLLVALQSIGELSSRDVLVILPLAALAYAYGMYLFAHRRNLGG